LKQLISFYHKEHHRKAEQQANDWLRVNCLKVFIVSIDVSVVDKTITIVYEFPDVMAAINKNF